MNPTQQQARKERLESALHTLAAWASNRARGDFDTDTTLTILETKVAEIRGSIDRAGWAANQED